MKSITKIIFFILIAKVATIINYYELNCLKLIPITASLNYNFDKTNWSKDTNFVGISPKYSYGKIFGLGYKYMLDSNFGMKYSLAFENQKFYFYDNIAIGYIRNFNNYLDTVTFTKSFNVDISYLRNNFSVEYLFSPNLILMADFSFSYLVNEMNLLTIKSNKQSFIINGSINEFYYQSSQINKYKIGSSIQIGFIQNLSYYFSSLLSVNAGYETSIGSKLINPANYYLGLNIAINYHLKQKCPSGFVLLNGECVPECIGKQVRLDNGECICPENMIFSYEINDCICKPGFKLIDDICVKENDNIAKLVDKNCPPAYYYSDSTQNCEPIFPTPQNSCKGWFLAFHLKTENQAKELLTVFNNNGLENFFVEKAVDVVDTRQKVWLLRTSCYPSSMDAYNVRKLINSMLKKLNLDEINNLNLEIISTN